MVVIVNFFRSSLLGSWSYCELKTLLVYNLGMTEPNGKKATLGTATHALLESLAIGKKYIQDNPTSEVVVIDHEHLGKFSFLVSDFYKIEELDNDTVDKINKSRKSKTIYKSHVPLKYGHKRMGQDCVNLLINKACQVYSLTSEDSWTPADFRDVNNWSWMTLDYLDGCFDPRNQDIISPEMSFDIELKRDWAKYSYEVKGEKFSGYLRLKGTIDLITRSNSGQIHIVDYKGLPLDTPIPTVDGWKTMGDLKIGDSIFDENGKITKVIGKSQVKYKDCYKITFDDKTSVICDDEHLWKIDDGSIAKVTDLKVKNKINIAKPLITNNIELPIDPYTLGMWLGDGRNRSGEITSGDQFIFEEIERRGYTLGVNQEKRNEKCSSRTVIGLTTELRKLGLLHNKHIPLIYLRASFEQRLDLLRGLMDSDGSINTYRKQGVFTNCNKKLSDDVLELLLSLGQRAHQDKTKQTGFGLTVDVYPVCFRPININPFLLPRKANKVDPNWGTGNSHRRLIKKIEKIGKDYTQCIMVDSETHTYLCTKNMIPTHNTGQRVDWGDNCKEKDFDYLLNDKQLMFYYYVASQLFPDDDIYITIFFIRDGGPFTIPFDRTRIPEIEQWLMEQFQEISSDELPKMVSESQTDFRCTRLCKFFKDGSCLKIANELKEKGLQYVIDNRQVPGFKIGTYVDPGATD